MSGSIVIQDGNSLYGRSIIPFRWMPASLILLVIWDEITRIIGGQEACQLLFELLSDSIWHWWSDSFLDRSLDCTSTILILRFLSNYVLSFLLEDMGHWYDDGVCVVRFYRGEIWGVGSYLSKGTYCILFRQLIFLRPEMIDCYEFLTRNLKHKIFSWKKKD